MAEYRIRLSDELKKSLISEAAAYGDSNDSLNDGVNISDTSRNSQGLSGQRPIETSMSRPPASYEKANAKTSTNRNTDNSWMTSDRQSMHCPSEKNMHCCNGISSLTWHRDRPWNSSRSPSMRSKCEYLYDNMNRSNGSATLVVQAENPAFINDFIFWDWATSIFLSGELTALVMCPLLAIHASIAQMQRLRSWYNYVCPMNKALCLKPFFLLSRQT